MTTFIHYFFHFAFPLIIAYAFFKKQWVRVYIVFILTMLIDLDHLLADPIFQACRCSIGFHPLHSYVAIPIYVLLLLLPKTRIWGLGFIMHIATDSIDCFLMEYRC